MTSREQARNMSGPTHPSAFYEDAPAGNRQPMKPDLPLSNIHHPTTASPSKRRPKRSTSRVNDLEKTNEQSGKKGMFGLGWLGRGMRNDILARAPYYWSDWTDTWNYRVIPATWVGSTLTFPSEIQLTYSWDSLSSSPMCFQGLHSP
jgi:hypothetical protein